MQTERLKVTGMTSGGCASMVARALKDMGGIRAVDVSFAGGDATVQYDERLTSPHQIKLAISGAGYGVAGGGTANT